MEERKAIIERIPTEEINKKKILEILEAITFFYQKSLFYIHNCVYLKTLDREMIEALQNYFSWVISLYNVLKPKFNLLEFGKKQKYEKELKELENYIPLILEMEELDIEDFFLIFIKFNEFENALREVCEELGYTSDKPKL